jgi:hypothetical protein
MSNNERMTCLVRIHSFFFSSSSSIYMIKNTHTHIHTKNKKKRKIEIIYTCTHFILLIIAIRLLYFNHEMYSNE